MGAQTQAKIPDVYVAEADFDRLSELCAAAAGPGARLLARELDRAIIVPDGGRAKGFVRLGSQVEYRDLLTGRTRTLTVVEPDEADIDRQRLSVVSPIGAALVGLQAGDLFALSTEDGRPRVLQVMQVR
jgi:regulator of nucleoside diphosphate kinase